MAKIIKVGSQNPTFTSQKIKKVSPLHTYRNSNEATNPFKFTNFEGNTLQFADVFEGFKPSFKASPANKLRIIASSVTGSMNKVRTNIAEPIVNFVRRVHGGLVSAWDYAKNTNFSDAVLAIPGARRINDGIKNHINTAREILNTPINIPVIDGLSEKMAGIKGGISSRMLALQDGAIDFGKDIQAQWSNIIAKLPSRARYTAATPVAELEAALRLELGGV